MQLQPGFVVFGRYVVESFAGAGSGGHLYVGHHQRIGHRVAMRVLPSSVNRETAARFERTARLMARIRHPNVVSVLDYGVIDGTAPCVVTEFTHGETLRDRLNRRQALPWPEMIHVLLGVLAGLDAIHAAAVLHRNLKPKNILIVPGNPEQIKLVDLSFAKSIFDDGSRITQVGVVVGTPAYMSPEQLMNQPFDPRSDLYAAGLVAYECLAGGMPNRSDDMSSLLARARSAPPPPIAPQMFPPLPPAVGQVVVRALQPNPASRFPNAVELARQLIAAGHTAAVPQPRAPAQAPPNPVPAAGPAPYRAASTQTTQALGQRPDAQGRGAWEKMHARSQLRMNVEGAQQTEQVSAPLRHEPARMRAIMAARVPPKELARREVRRWLDKLLGEGGRSFTLGEQFWLAAIGARSDAAARGAAEAILGQLGKRWGGQIRSAWAPVDEGFTLSDACIQGSAPPPFEILELLEQVAEF